MPDCSIAWKYRARQWRCTMTRPTDTPVWEITSLRCLLSSLHLNHTNKTSESSPSRCEVGQAGPTPSPRRGHEQGTCCVYEAIYSSSYDPSADGLSRSSQFASAESQPVAAEVRWAPEADWEGWQSAWMWLSCWGAADVSRGVVPSRWKNGIAPNHPARSAAAAHLLVSWWTPFLLLLLRPLRNKTTFGLNFLFHWTLSRCSYPRREGIWYNLASVFARCREIRKSPWSVGC